MITTVETIKQSIISLVHNMATKVEMTIQKGTPLHELEKDIFADTLKIGKLCIDSAFFQAGAGDVGEQLELEGHKQLNRLDKQRRGCYLSMFGHHDYDYFAYGSREGQKIEFIPLYNHLSLPDEKYSYFLQDFMEKTCIETPYKKTHDFFNDFLPSSIPVSGLERTNSVLAASSKDFWDQQSSAAEASPEQLIVIQSDGKGVVTRPEKQEAPKIKTKFEEITSSPSKKTHNGRKKIAIVGSVYTLDTYPRRPNDVLDSLFRKRDEATLSEDKTKQNWQAPIPLEKRIRTSLERDDKDTLAPARTCIFDWQQKEQRQRDPNNQATHIYLMDGEKALWDKVSDNAIGKNHVEILDLLHASGYIWMASKALHPYTRNKDSLLDGFVKNKIKKVLKGEIKEVCDELRVLAKEGNRSENALKKIEKATCYLENNAHRMKYNEYLEKGYPIASGVIEGACRYIVKDRMERTGMRWVLSGAEAMLNLRCIALNGDWDEFMKFHINKIQKKRYVMAANDDFFWGKIPA